ncbi:DUF6527 family protein [Noviherbaspirillum sp. ST 5-3]|uniref:DUF6527 family protein n=1 Tax=Noviherbaspirillum sp. ST 5-3 TaxID=3349878 RepID=UPI003916EA6A
MSIFSILTTWLKRKAKDLPVPADSPRGTTNSRRDLPPIHFASVSTIPKVLPNEGVEPGRFYVVAHNDNLYWALFRCPDGCGDVISLPLRAPHNPRWSVQANSAGRVTLKPSVWRNQGCKAHFILEDGRIFWCNDSGIEPSLARPDIYRRR